MELAKLACGDTGVFVERIAKVFVSLMFLGLWTLNVEASPTDFPGMIPIGTDGQQAVDVVDAKGAAVLPEVLTQELKRGTDISKLNPAASDLWQNKTPGPLDPSSYTLGIPSGAEMEMASNTPSVVGEYRFIVNFQNNGAQQQFQILLSKKAHNVLLRKALLEKLGYKIQPVQWMPKLRVHFNGHASLMGFLTDVQNNTEGSPDRWITNNMKDPNSDYVDLQDVLLFPADALYYSLETGAIPSSVIEGRRVLNSLLVPYELTDVPESVNSFAWTAGRIVNQSVYLQYDWAQWFNPTFQDAQWIARRMAALSAQDWQDVAKASQVPAEVAALVSEKLKSRRNDILHLLQIPATALSVNTKISSGKNLVSGKLTAQNWPGYASRFSFGDPENPLSSDEIKAFLKAKVTSSVMDSVMSYINKFFNNNTSVQNQVDNHVLQNLADQMVTEALTGQKTSIPLGMYVIPSFSGNIILSREVVIGSYMGTDNLVQMADNFGFSVTPGAFVGISGLGSVSESANIGLQVQRIYTHIKPLQSIKAVSNTPYKNMIIPLLKRQWANDLTAVTDASGKIDLNAMATALDQDMGVGESLIISDSLTAQAGLTLTYPATPSVDLQAKFNAAQMFLHRVQIYKLDKHTFQIYNDPGRVTQGGASLGVDLQGIPLLTISVSAEKGTVQTSFYSLPIGSDDPDQMSQNANQYMTNVHVLQQIFTDNSLETLRSQQNPYVIGHDFTETDWGLGFLYFQVRKASVKDRFLFQAPTGQQSAVLYRSTGVRTGKDYFSLLSNIFTSFLQRKTGNSSIAVDTTSSGNPGDTFLGSAVTRQVIYEGSQSNAKDANSGLSTSQDGEFAQVTHTHKGWNISKANAQQILADMNRQFGFQINSPLLLSDTNKILLYSITLTMNIYKAGILKLAQMPKNQVEQLMKPIFLAGCPDFIQTGPDCGAPRQQYNAHVYYFEKAQQNYLTARAANGPQAADLALSLVDAAEAYFPGKTLVDIVGANNVLVQSRVQGFRENDEQGDTPLMGSTIGLVGSKMASGPLSFIEQNLQVLNGEFFVTWLMNPL